MSALDLHNEGDCWPSECRYCMDEDRMVEVESNEIEKELAE